MMLFIAMSRLFGFARPPSLLSLKWAGVLPPSTHSACRSRSCNAKSDHGYCLLFLPSWCFHNYTWWRQSVPFNNPLHLTHTIWRIKGKLWHSSLSLLPDQAQYHHSPISNDPLLTFWRVIPPHIDELQYNLRRQGHVQPQRDKQSKAGSFSLSLGSHQGDWGGSYHTTASSNSPSRPGQSPGCATSTALRRQPVLGLVRAWSCRWVSLRDAAVWGYLEPPVVKRSTNAF